MHRHTRSRDAATNSSHSHGVANVLARGKATPCYKTDTDQSQASGGGPAEDNVTGFLVRSLSTKWNKNSVLAVDAGSHLASIMRILEDDFPKTSQPAEAKRSGNGNTPRKLNGHEGSRSLHRPASETGYESSDCSECSSAEPDTRILERGPFAGLPFPFESARANALHVVRECVSTYLITHPHLDHLSAFAINTAAFHNTSRPKRLAALPSTVNAIKTHIFNDVIWPNLTDEDGGVGFVSFQRLAEGGNVTLGEGRRRGFIEVCDGLCVKALKISHGQCVRGPAATAAHRGSDVGLSHATISNQLSVNLDVANVSPTRTKRPSFSLPPGASGAGGGSAGASAESSARPATAPGAVVVDSTAYFIQEDGSGREVLMFGDVEPDAISLSPRTAAVWAEAAPKVASGHLKAIVIECSYDDSQGDKVLFGHLAPRWLIRELNCLAGMVRLSKAERRASRKRKRSNRSSDGNSASVAEPETSAMLPPASTTQDDDDTSDFHTVPTKKGRRVSYAGVSDGDVDPTDGNPMSPDSRGADDAMGKTHRGSGDLSSISSNGGGGGVGGLTGGISARPSISLSAAQDADPPLAGVTVIIMHIKDTFKDGPLVGESILKQLNEHEARIKEQDGVGLGCEFVISEAGGSYLF